MPVITLPAPKHRRWTWPDWPAGLFEDFTGHHYDDPDTLDRNMFDECSRAVGRYNAPALLSDLVAEGTLDLTRHNMAGVVPAVWAASEYPESALSRARWVELFRGNGFTRDGYRADVPTEPVELHRGCVPAFVAFDGGGRLVGVDPHGRPADPYGEVAEVWHTACGMNWTTDFPAARRLAFRGPVGRAYGRVFTARIAPEHLLAQAGADVIVDPAVLVPANMVESGRNTIGIAVAAVAR